MAMRSRILSEDDGVRTIIAVLQTGDEAMECLKAIAGQYSVASAQISAIGAFERAELAFFEWVTKKYLPIPVDEQVEVLSLLGDVALDGDGAPSLHLHAVLGYRDGTTRGGHFVRGWVRPTLEVMITETPAHLHRVRDPETGLALIRPEKA